MARPRGTVDDFTDPYIGTFAPPPSIRDGVCDVCHGAPNPGYARCLSCSQTTAQVTHPVKLVVPISLYEIPGQLHHVLRYYKDGYSEDVRSALRLRVAALLWRFLSAHEACIVSTAGAQWDVITSVPSSGQREGRHPLEDVIALARRLAEQYQSTLVRGDGPLAHNQASDTGYTVTEHVGGANILLIDDTFTSGARIQSAASALTLAGANVVAAVPIGRVIKPGYNEASAALWESARSAGFDFGVCCLER